MSTSCCHALPATVDSGSLNYELRWTLMWPLVRYLVTAIMAVHRHSSHRLHNMEPSSRGSQSWVRNKERVIPWKWKNRGGLWWGQQVFKSQSQFLLIFPEETAWWGKKFPAALENPGFHEIPILHILSEQTSVRPWFNCQVIILMFSCREKNRVSMSCRYL